MIALGNQGDCTLDNTGTGIRNCDLGSLGDLKGNILLEKGWFKAITDGMVDFDLAAFLLAVKGLQAFPLKGLYDFGQDTPENEQNTSSTGIIQEVRSGKPQFSFMFTKGTCFHKTLFNKRGQGKWDHILVFESGILMAENNDGTKLKGFDGGMFSVETFKLLQGTDLEMSTAKIQLIDAIEFNARNVFIPFDVSGDIGSVDGVIETKIVVDPIAAGTAFSAKITSACNTGDVVLDLDTPADYALLGTQASATTISTITFNVTTQKYDFVVSPALVATDTVQIQMNDGTFKVIEDTAGGLYKGTSNTVIVS